MGQQAGTGGKGRPPPNPNNGSGSTVDNSNGIANTAQASGTVLNGTPPQTNSTNPAQTTSMTATAPLAQTSTQNQTTDSTNPVKGQSKGNTPQPPAQSTYAATMQAALNGAPAPVPGGPATPQPPLPAGTMSSQMMTAMTPQTRGGETTTMPLQNPNSVGTNTPTDWINALQNTAQTGGVGAVMDALGKSQGKGGTPQAPQGMGGGTAPQATPQNNFTDGFPTTRAGPLLPASTDWSKVDPTVQRTADGNAQIVDKPDAMFSFTPGSLGEKMANFTFKGDNLEPWQKNYNALPPQMRLQYAAASTGASGNSGQGNELLAKALQDEGGFTKQQTDMFRNAFGTSGGSALGPLGAQGLGISTNSMAIGGGAVHLEGNTLWRAGPNGERIIMARLPYAQTMGREANGAVSGAYSQKNSQARMGRTNEVFQGATGTAAPPSGATGTTGAAGAPGTGVAGATGLTMRTARPV